MPIAFKCPSCSKPIRVKDELAGRKGKCPGCGEPLVIPTQSPNPRTQRGTVQPAPVRPKTKEAFAESNPYQVTSTDPRPMVSATGPTGGSSHRVLKRIDVGSCAYLMGALYAALGLLMGVFFFVFAAIGGLAGGGQAALAGIGGGLFMMIALPVMYGLSGLIGGALLAFGYNATAKYVGGIKIEVGS